MSPDTALRSGVSALPWLCLSRRRKTFLLTFFGVCGFILLVLLLGIVGGGVILFDFETSLGRAACFTAIFFLSVWAFGRAWARESKIPPGDSLPLWGKTLLLLSAPGCFVWGAGIYAAGHVPLANACYNAVIANDMKQLRQCVALRAAIRRHPDYKGDYSVRAFMPDTYAAFHEIVAEDQELTPLRLEMLLLLLPEFTTSFHEGHLHRFFSLPPSPLRQRLLAAILEQNSMITRVSLQEYDNLVARGDKAALALLLEHDWKHKYSDLAHPFNLLQNTRPSPLRTEILQNILRRKRDAYLTPARLAFFEMESMGAETFCMLRRDRDTAALSTPEVTAWLQRYKEVLAASALEELLRGAPTPEWEEELTTRLPALTDEEQRKVHDRKELYRDTARFGPDYCARP